MYICIGGDLNGEVVAGREGTYFEASEINTEKVYIQSSNLRCW
jgi:hypothetical protein